MESFDGSGFATVGSRKKRSNAPRRPCPAANLLCYKDLSSAVQPVGSGSHGDVHEKNGSNESGNENKLKLKLKLGGATHTIQTKYRAEVDSGGAPIVIKSSHSSGVSQKKPNIQGKASIFLNDSDEGRSCDTISVSGSGHRGYTSQEIVSGSNINGNVTEQYEPTRKSKRVPKRRVLDVGFNSDDEEDAEMRYLGKLRASTGRTDYDDEPTEINQRDPRFYEDKDYVREEKCVSDDDDDDGFRRKKLRKSSTNDSFMEGRKDSAQTAHDPTLQPEKYSFSLARLIEFPDGLPLAPSKKRKEKLNDVEQQLKKVETAQRRRMQSEKTAREAEAEAIRKILGQDSGRKKKEEKMRKQRDELAQERASKSETLSPNTVRWIIGPTRTTVIFSKDVGLPNIFSSVPCSYPPAREKCVAPNCTNSYKYRDSKSKLPLCSLNCYKEVHEKMQTLMAS